MLSDSDVLSALMRRAPAHSLAQELYCDPGVFRADMAHIWYRDWLFAIPACEIPKPGAYVVHEVGAYSVVIVRGNDGAIRAFHNTCRHRGSVLCRTKSGTNPRLVCPYHQWTYELDGRLLWARDMGPDFDASRHGLKPVHCRNVAGLVYICLAETVPPIEEFAATAARYLAPHDLENSKVAFESTIVEQGNWKLVWENNRECYHCAGNHPSLCRTFPEDPRYIGSDNSGVLSEVAAAHDGKFHGDRLGVKIGEKIAELKGAAYGENYSAASVIDCEHMARPAWEEQSASRMASKNEQSHNSVGPLMCICMVSSDHHCIAGR